MAVNSYASALGELRVRDKRVRCVAPGVAAFGLDFVVFEGYLGNRVTHVRARSTEDSQLWGSGLNSSMGNWEGGWGWSRAKMAGWVIWHMTLTKGMGR